MYNLEDMCPCGSQRAYGACCGIEESCSCGSGESAGNCCFADKSADTASEDGDETSQTDGPDYDLDNVDE